LNSIPEREDIQIIIIDDNSDPEIVDFSSFPGQNKKKWRCRFCQKSWAADCKREWLNKFVDIFLTNTRKGEKLLRYLFVVPWVKLIKKDLIDRYSIKFEETKIHNDIAFSYLSRFFANSIKANSRELYCWVYRENSLSQQNKEPAIILDKIYVYASIYRRLRAADMV
jgi:hypothetical protein